MKVATALIAAAFLTGCATTSDIRSSNPASTAQVEASVHSVYQSARQFVRDCKSTNMITAQVGMDSDFDDANQTGHVDQVMTGALGPNVIFVIDVSKVSTNQTRVAVSAHNALLQSGQSQAVKSEFLQYPQSHRC